MKIEDMVASKNSIKGRYQDFNSSGMEFPVSEYTYDKPISLLTSCLLLGHQIRISE